MRVIILGAGGHAKVIIDILQLQGTQVVGLLDDDERLWGTQVLGLPVMGGINQLSEFESMPLICAIGANAIRKAVVDKLAVPAERWVNAIHPSAIVARSAHLGHGVVVAAQAVINPDCSVSRHVIINTGATVDHDCTIDDFSHIAPGAHLAGGCRVGQGALVGIGAQMNIGTSVGAWATIGAGATVIHDVPAAKVAKGTPARWQ